MGSDYSRLAASYDRFRDREALAERWARSMLELARFPPKGRLVEVGSGTGNYLAAFGRVAPGAALLAVEPERAMLAQAATKGLGPLVRARGEALPLRSGSLDAVAFLFSLHHFADPQEGIREAARVLRPGGSLLVLTRSHAQLGESVMALFPGVLEVDRARFPDLPRVGDWARAAGLARPRSRLLRKAPEDALPVEAWLERAGGDFISTLQHLTERERKEGFPVFEERLRDRYGESVRDRSGFTLVAYGKPGTR